jgi:hypothetical protein
MGGEGSGNFGHAGRPELVGGSAPGNPLDSSYGGMPGGEVYTSATEYSLSHQRYVEAAHCILGSLGKQQNTDIVNAEEGHVREEIKIMNDCITEYSRQLYNEQLKRTSTDPEYKKYYDKTIQNIKDASPELYELATKQRARCDAIKDPVIRQVAKDAYTAIATLAMNAQRLDEGNAGVFNVWRTSEIQEATRQLESSINKLYPKYNRQSSYSKPIDNRRV